MGWGLVFFVATIVISAYLSYTMRPDPPDAVKPAFEDLEVPTVSASAPIPRVYGTKWLKSANVVWYGDLRTEPIKKESGGK